MVKKIGVVFFLTTLLLSCTTLYTDKYHYNDVDSHLFNNDPVTALESFQSTKDKAYKEKDKVLYYIEEGILYRMAGMYNESNESFTSAEYYIEELLTKSISKGIQSGLLNDNALDYSGEDYEDIYINIFKALNYIQLDQISEALIEIRRANFKLENLEYKYAGEIEEFNSLEGTDLPNNDVNFYNDAFARYISSILYRVDRDEDDFRIEVDKLVESFSNQRSIYDYPMPSLPNYSSDKAVISVISFTGLAPEKVADTVYISNRGSQIILGSDTNFTGFNTFRYNGLDKNINLKLQFPRYSKLYNPVKHVELYVDGRSYGKLELLEDVNNIAIETFKLKQPLIVGKTIVRSITKSVVTNYSSNKIRENLGDGLGFLSDIAKDVYLNVSENSDLRSVRYLPSDILVKEMEIEPGYHDISIKYYNSRKDLLHQEDFLNQNIQKGKINLFESSLIRY